MNSVKEGVYSTLEEKTFGYKYSTLEENVTLSACCCMQLVFGLILLGFYYLSKGMCDYNLEILMLIGAIYHISVVPIILTF